MNVLTRSITVLLVSAILTAGSALMIGPQIMIIVPVTVLAGTFFAIRRSFLSLVCFGYPLTFGLVSAWLGRAEISEYTQTTAFVLSVLIGIAGVGMMSLGLWKALSKRADEKAGGCAQEGDAGKDASHHA